MNNSFSQFYRDTTSSDLILELNGEKFRCHQFVFLAKSQYLKSALIKIK